MGMGAELLDEMLWEMEIAEERMLWHIENGIWITRDNEDIDIRDMDQRHLDNCIAFLKRNEAPRWWHKAWIEAMECERKRRAVTDFLPPGLVDLLK